MPPVSSSLHESLLRGSTGTNVKTLQQLLNRAGFDTDGVDGDFGPVTRKAVQDFQRSKGLPVDGIAGPATLTALQKAPAAAPTAPVARGANDGIMNLEAGSTGNSVVTLQKALKAAGFNPGATDGNFGPTTDAALRRFQASKGIQVDGVAGNATWRALRGPTGNDSFGNSTQTSSLTGATSSVTRPPAANDAALRARIVSIAENEVGTLEKTNHNDGAVLKYPNAFGRGSEAYCADFVSWVNTQAGNPMNDPYCPHIKDTLVADGRWKGKQNPQPGDMVLFDWNGDRQADHIGIVKSVNANGTITTIEGNTGTGKAGAKEGVHERTRTLDTVLGFGSPT